MKRKASLFMILEVLLFIFIFAYCSTAASAAAKKDAVIFNDPFNVFDNSRWIKSEFTLERSILVPSNISIDNGYLKMKLPAGTLEGAEIESVNYYGYGSYTVRMKLPNAPSSITGFFLYRSPDFYNEIDIEIYNDNSRKIDFTTYAGGKVTHTVTKTLGFDATKDFHNYTIVYNKNAVEFYVDNQLLQKWSGGITTNTMKLLLNAWYPNWLEGTPPATDQFLVVDYIKGENISNKTAAQYTLNNGNKNSGLKLISYMRNNISFFNNNF